MSRAARPDTCGAAMEVPESRAVRFPGTQDQTRSPGAIRSGATRRGCAMVWLEEPDQTSSASLQAPTETTWT